jgi:hypothetical protein
LAAVGKKHSSAKQRVNHVKEMLTYFMRCRAIGAEIDPNSAPSHS